MSETEPTRRKRNDAELLAISYTAFMSADLSWSANPSDLTRLARRVWARALQIDQIVTGASIVKEDYLRSIVARDDGEPNPLEHIERAR
jgi:hypothetical protein